jgi:Raf kinase inhibitor-like YbhB/YbcL family protein
MNNTLTAQSTLNIRSPYFQDGGYIPSRFTCDGANINPELTIHALPNDTKTMALTIEDVDAPDGVFDHWVIWNIPAQPIIQENSFPGTQGKNSMNESSYLGPCPPTGLKHHYHFTIYALDTELHLPANSVKEDLLQAIEGHVLAKGKLIGLYKK